jgi:hypothetical protein
MEKTNPEKPCLNWFLRVASVFLAVSDAGKLLFPAVHDKKVDQETQGDKNQFDPEG